MSIMAGNQDIEEEIFKPRNQFSEFCEETTLNGWYYLAKRSVGKVGRSYWLLVVVGSLILSGWFIYGATNEFMDASVIITVDSVTASLDKVLFPSLVVCNQNQVISKEVGEDSFNHAITNPTLYKSEISNDSSAAFILSFFSLFSPSMSVKVSIIHLRS